MNQVYFPDNIFAKIIYNSLDEIYRRQVSFKPSAILSKQVSKGANTISLIPVSDIITNKDLFISKAVGISFQESLCNSYIYYDSDLNEVTDIAITGDISTLEVVFGKILFRELYNIDVEMIISTGKKDLSACNHIITGDINFTTNGFNKGISFAEEIIEIITAPFVGYVLASQNKTLLKDYTEKISDQIKKSDFTNIDFPDEFPEESRIFMASQLESVRFNLNEQDIEGINNLVRLPYYYGLIKDIVEIKYV